MQADWFLVQLTADLRRHEPRNIGVVVNCGSTWQLRFRGMDANGNLNGHHLRSLGVSKSTYESWVGYFSRKAHAGQWEDVLSLPRKRPSNFSVIPAGTILEVEGDPRFLADRLFGEMVSVPDRHPQAPFDLAKRLFADAHVEVHERIHLPGRWYANTPEVNIPFDFGLGTESRVTLEALSPNELAISHLRTRMDAIDRMGVSTRIIALLPLSRAEESHIDDLLRPVEKNAHVLDLDASDAPENLLQMIS
ncbi:hypothetical protein ACR9WD_05820 [Glutamicibacter sp. PAEs-4]|uniref:hypothetical protein n=1 Tax=Glutamicibacter sp. PAEs-4 TaxID=3444114 RepID=UPI003EBB8725